MGNQTRDNTRFPGNNEQVFHIFVINNTFPAQITSFLTIWRVDIHMICIITNKLSKYIILGIFTFLFLFFTIIHILKKIIKQQSLIY